MRILNGYNREIFASNIVSSDNCLITDESGKKYVDFESGVWCTPLGHNNKRINDAIINQINVVSHVGYRYSSIIVDEAAEKVLELFGFVDGRCVFLASGSEAVEFGVQLAKKIMDMPLFLCLKDYFLSSYGISSTRSEDEWISLDLAEYKGNPNEFLADVPFDKVGAFVFEPGNASGLVKLPPKELIKAIAHKIKENNGIIVVNEVTTGTGRTGKWFGHEHYDISPDIVSFGKGIGNGYPVSVSAFSKRVSELAEKSDFRYAQSHQNDPLGCAVVKEVITVIEEKDLIKNSAEMGAILERELRSQLGKHECLKEVRGVGLMYVLEFDADVTFSLEAIHRELFDAGYVTGISPNLLRFYPPLTITESQIKNMVNTLDAILLKHSE
jgi:acetylornithine aminotransferase